MNRTDACAGIAPGFSRPAYNVRNPHLIYLRAACLNDNISIGTHPAYFKPRGLTNPGFILQAPPSTCQLSPRLAEEVPAAYSRYRKSCDAKGGMTQESILYDDKPRTTRLCKKCVRLTKGMKAKERKEIGQ